MPLPKSGSNIISPKVINKILSIGKTPFLKLFNSLLFFSKYLLVKIISDSLANSDGWIPKLPIPNQLLLPFLTLPIPGIKTSPKRIKAIIKKILAYL